MEARPVSREGCGPQLGGSETMSNGARLEAQRVGRNARVSSGGRLRVGSPAVHRYGWVGREIQGPRSNWLGNVDDRRASAKTEEQRRSSDLGRYADEKT